MVVTKENINNFIKCPFLFGKNVLSDKYKIITEKESIERFKKHVVELASYEMKENVKLDLAEYRSSFTNKYFTSKKSLDAFLDPSVLIPMLNTLFSVFANKVFIGYNLPIDINIAGTNMVYRDIIDFGLIDEEENITFVEIVDLTSISPSFEEKVKNWVHYFIPYSFLASSFNKTINVVFIDPDIRETVEFVVHPEKFDLDYIQLCEFIKTMKTHYIYKNLYMCSNCEQLGNC